MDEETSTAPQSTSQSIVDLMVDQPSTDLAGHDYASIWTKTFRPIYSTASSGVKKIINHPTRAVVAVFAGISAYVIYRKLSGKMA